MTIVVLDVVSVRNSVLGGALRSWEIDSVLPDTPFPHLRNLIFVMHVGAVSGCARTWPLRSINALKHKILHTVTLFQQSIEELSKCVALFCEILILKIFSKTKELT